MTTLRTLVDAPAPDAGGHDAGQPAIDHVIARLREAAARMIAFSETKTLLREAATTIERLHSDGRHHEAEVARLTMELDRVRAATRHV
jgi:hypothetical protein